jgi:hypothetical protein
VSPARWTVILSGVGLLGVAATITAMLLWRENPTATHITALDLLVAPGLRVAGSIMRSTRSFEWSGARFLYFACLLNGLLWSLVIAILTQGWRLVVNTHRAKVRDRAV